MHAQTQVHGVHADTDAHTGVCTRTHVRALLCTLSAGQVKPPAVCEQHQVSKTLSFMGHFSQVQRACFSKNTTF